ncbi:MAG: zf-TFIIB domain-containing protein [Gloeobacteraceae cyanobacterium ES-bin-316]|nr:zf-TFIIB domain-containing protein [Ferruginibacter sp.]
MKTMKIMFTMALAICCFGTANAQTKKSKSNTVTQAAATYQCPMKCEGDKTYSKAGRCPVCNMNLKAVEKPLVATYQCPMKCEGDKAYNKAGKCPVCNMNLTKTVTSKNNQPQRP